MNLFNGFLLIILFIYGVTCDSTEEDPSDIATLLKTYKSYINASHDLDKSDRSLLKLWTTDFQIQLVNVTTQYRLEMIRHKEHNFAWIKNNAVWMECIDSHRLDINTSERNYFEVESKCLREANAEESRKRQSVYQLEKEIRKWRKSYRYLLNQCNMNNAGDEEAAGECLVEFMQKDNYYTSFQRLILLKLESMSNLYSQTLVALKSCEECLKMNLSSYFTNVRSTMEILNRCYRKKSSLLQDN